MTRLRSLGFVLALPLSALSVNLTACSSDSTGAEPSIGGAERRAESALAPENVTVVTREDFSAAPVRIQIKECTTVGAATAHVGVDCVVDPEYALVGGGAATISTSGSASYLAESRPLDARTWRASSSAGVAYDAHQLSVYAIGMQLDGVRTKDLQNAIRFKQVQTATGVATVQIDNGYLMIGGGAQTARDPNNTSTADRHLSSLYPTGFHEWMAVSTDYAVPAPGTTTGWVLEIPDQILEGFGGLEIKILQAHSASASSGYSTSTVQIEPGWALIGMGGNIEYANAAQSRMLVSIQPGSDSRSVSVTSRDQMVASAGSTTAYAMVARKKPGTHGLCNPGPSIPNWSDSCVAAICAQRNSCCTSGWDDSCVNLVQPVCGRSCAEHTCVPTVYEPEKWTYDDGSPVQSNCYYYAQNKYPVSGVGMDPGYSLGMRPTDPLDSHYFDRLAAGDGLIPSSLDAVCPDNRTKIYMYANPGSYHVYRQDGNGAWSDKFGSWGLAVLTPDTGVRPQHWAPQGNPVEAYMCACNHPLPDQLPPRR